MTPDPKCKVGLETHKRNLEKRMLKTVLAASLVAISLGGSALAASECRTIEHVMGTDCVPINPQRVVVLDPLTALPTLLDLDVPIVATAQVYPGDEGFPDYFEASALKDIALLGSMREINLEAVLAAKPDLIIGDVVNMGEDLEQLRRIAPTVVTNFAYYDPDWQDQIRLIGEAVGKGQEIEARIEAFNKKAATLKSRFDAEGVAPELSKIDIYGGQPLFYRWDCVWFGDVLASAGVRQPEHQKGACTAGDPRSVIVMVSQEEITDLLDGNTIAIYQQLGGSALETVKDWPTWNEIDAVKNGAVFSVTDAWGVGASLQAGYVILDALDKQLFPKQ